MNPLLGGGCSHDRAKSYWFESVVAANREDIAFESHLCEDYKHFDKGLCRKKCDDSSCVHMGEGLEVDVLRPDGQLR